MPRSAEQVVTEMEPELLVKARHKLPGAIRGGVTASDVVQETIRAALEPIAAGDRREWDEARLRKFTFRILNNKLADALRSAYRNRSVAGSVSDVLDLGPTPSGVAVSNERSKRLKDALEQLDERDRNLLIMRHERGFTLKQIGEKLGGISAQAVSQAYKRAVDKFKKVYGPDSGPV